MQSAQRIIFANTADTRLAISRPQRKFDAAAPAIDTAAEEATEWNATLTGYALVWNSLSQDRGGYFVRLAPYSAKFAPRVLALWEHENRDTIGNTANGSLRFTSDSYGVKVEIDLPDTTAGHDLAELVEDGYVTGMSFGMVDMPSGNRTTENGKTILNATSYIVDEVTVTADPAFTAATITLATESPSSDYSVRRAQALKLQHFRFGSLRLQGQTLPVAAH